MLDKREMILNSLPICTHYDHEAFNCHSEYNFTIILWLSQENVSFFFNYNVIYH
jgi:hypothetical protein